MSAATIATIVAIGKGIWDLGSYIRERRQARKHPAKPCPPPAHRARPVEKQAPKQSGKR